MFNRISLRMRLTILTALVMMASMFILTWLSINRSNMMIEPLAMLTTAGENYNISLTQGIADSRAVNEAIFSTKEVDDENLSVTIKVDDKTETVKNDYVINLSEDDYVEFANVSPIERIMVPAIRLWENTQQKTDAMSVITVTVNAQKKFALSSTTIMVLVMAVAVIVTWFAVGKALKPVRALTSAISEINENNLSLRLDGFKADDEIKRLAENFNQMLDKLEAAFSAQKNFSVNAAHELKTPLAAIRANIEVLAMDSEPKAEECLETLAIVGRNTDRLIGLVDDLLRINSDTQCAFDEVIDAETLLTAIIAELGEKIDAKRITVQVNNTLEVIYGNYRLLYSALLNLADNGIKYNKDGGKLTICADAIEDAVVISVSDSGIGIAEKDLPHIFEPFYRVDPSRSRQIAGSGLGLALVATIAQKHRGRVLVYSKPDEGTTFTLLLPYGLKQRWLKET